MRNNSAAVYLFNFGVSRCIVVTLPYIIALFASLISAEEKGSGGKFSGCDNYGNGASLGTEAIDGRHGASRRLGYDWDRPNR
jgi:hypothetical protein